MGFGTAVQLSETTNLIPVFDPRLRNFVVQLWQDGNVTAVLGELAPYAHPDDVLDAIGDFLSSHGLAPLSESQMGELAGELITAKGGPDAAMLQIAIEQALLRSFPLEQQRTPGTETGTVYCKVDWARTAAYVFAAERCRHEKDGSPLEQVIISARSNGPQSQDSRQLTLHYANGGVENLSVPEADFDEDLAEVTDEIHALIESGTLVSFPTWKKLLACYEPTDVATVAARLLGPGWTDESSLTCDAILRHADDTTVRVEEEFSTSSDRVFRLTALSHDGNDITVTDCLSHGQLANLPTAASACASSVRSFHGRIFSARMAAESDPSRPGLRYQVHAVSGQWAVYDVASGFQAAADLPDTSAADKLAAELSLMALGGPTASLAWEQRRPDGSTRDCGEGTPAELIPLLTYHGCAEGAGTTYEWAADRIVIRYADGDVTTIRPVQA
jgi:hypothetical protein